MAGSRVSLAYVEMALSITISFFAGKVCEKHGFGKRRGWIFLLLLSAIDLAVATGQLVMNGGNTGAQQILDAIKFSVDFPVILIAIISVLQRV